MPQTVKFGLRENSLRNNSWLVFHSSKISTEANFCPDFSNSLMHYQCSFQKEACQFCFCIDQRRFNTKATQLPFTVSKIRTQIFCYRIFSAQLFRVKTCVLRAIKKQSGECLPAFIRAWKRLQSFWSLTETRSFGWVQPKYPYLLSCGS